MAAGSLSVSRAEVRALLLRAARGAGFPLGHCEDIARAFAEFGTDEFDHLAASLERGWAATQIDNEEIYVFREARALVVLPMACDILEAGVARVRLVDLDCPDLVGPMLASDGWCRRKTVFAETEGEDIILTHDTATPKPPRRERLVMSNFAYQQLSALAARTYVPTTEASRSGAGAGAIDND